MSEPKRWRTTEQGPGPRVRLPVEVVAAEEYDRLRERKAAADEYANEVIDERDEARALATQLADALREIAGMTVWSDYTAQVAQGRARAALAVFDAKEKT